MDITPPSANAAVGAQSALATAKLAQNFDTFLTLLTTQLQHQDPLSPQDSTEFTSQLAQFTNVEQNIAANKNLEKLIELTFATDLTNAVGFIGREARVETATATFANGRADWEYVLDAPAATTILTVTDELGRTVDIKPGETEAGSHVFTWDGIDRFGNPLPPGLYRLKVEATSAEGDTVDSTTFIRGLVSGIEIEKGEPRLVVGDQKIDRDMLVSVSLPGA